MKITSPEIYLIKNSIIKLTNTIIIFKLWAMKIKNYKDLRDTLLPKLMSGEIEIPDDIEVNNDELSI